MATQPALRRRPASTRLGRVLRGLRPDHNPLRRPTDRVQSAILAVLIGGFCIGAPVLGYAVAAETHSLSVAEMRAEHGSYHQVRATLLNAAVTFSTYPMSTAPEADARWNAPDGRKVTGMVTTPAGAQAGRTVMIWTDRSGQYVTLLSRDAVIDREIMAVTAAVAGLGAIMALADVLALCALNRRRLTAWELDWQATEPRWTSRH